MKSYLTCSITFCIIGLLSFSACAPKEPIKALDIQEKLSGFIPKNDTIQSSETKIDLCKITDFAWDELVVVHAYTTSSELETLELTNEPEVEDIIEDVVYQDNKSTLLFVKDQQAVAYSIVYPKPIYFTSLRIKPGSAFAKIKYEECNRLAIVKNSEPDGQSYFLVHK